jgi:hypothetical protein
MDQRQSQDQDACTEIVNFTVDENGCWDNRIGYERYFPGQATFAPFASDLAIDGLFIWETHLGARSYVLYQTGSALKYLKGNPASAVTLRTDRTAPATNEIGPDFAQAGRYLVIVNGHDEPLLYRGESRLYQLGFSTVPPALHPWGIDTTKPAGATALPDEESVQIPAGYRDAGLGGDVADDENRYRWRYSWLFEDGSESPLSPVSEDVAWTTAGSGASWNAMRMVAYLDGIEPGPVGTVGRIVYRTRNLIDWNNQDGADELFYRVGLIPNNSERSFYDHLADSQLGSLAPDDSASVTFPCLSAHTCAFYRGSLFVAGRADPFRLYYSVAGRLMQFRALDYFDVGSRAGGGIVKLHTFYDHLLVFRQRAIDAVRYTAEGGFVLTPLVEGIGTEAGQTVTTVPGLGVLFLGYDGVYLVAGSMIGGATMEVKRVSDLVERTCMRLNSVSMPRAVACYSPKWKEWLCHFPADGSDINNLGLVLHLRNNAWSLRETWPVGTLAVNGNGDIIFGHNQGNTSGLDLVPAGLFVISRRRCKGQVSNGLAPPALVDEAPHTSRIKSAWVDMQNAAVLKKARYVEMVAKTQGDNETAVVLYADYRHDGETGPSHSLQVPRRTALPVWNTATWNGTGCTWEEERLVDVRYDLDPQRSAVRYAWEVETTNDLVVQGYLLDATSRGQRETEGRA